MNVFDIENKRQNLLEQFPLNYGKSRVFLFYNFYKALIDSREKSLIDAFSLEFIEDYINSIKQYSPNCINPDKSYELIEQLKFLSSLHSLKFFHEKLSVEIDRIENLLSILKSILAGETVEETSNQLSFPLLEDNNNNSTEVFGILEKIRITISRSKAEDKFYIFPNTGNLDKSIEDQIKNSFSVALNYLKKYKNKFQPYHEILVYFDNYNANYVGNSFGIAITVGFIEQLSVYYNLPYLVKIEKNVASTGGMDSDGKILAVGQKNIERKTEAVFYSSIETFIIPKDGEPDALQQLTRLSKLYPNKKLRIIGVTDLQDIFYRRNLVDISKQNPIIRSLKASKKNWQITILIVILYVLTALTLIRGLDNNPAVLDNLGNVLYVKNKSGKVLWTKNINYAPNSSDAAFYPKYVQKLVDINKDGVNEVLIASESTESIKNPNDYGEIACYDLNNSLIWKYNFNDTTFTKTEMLQPLYTSNMIDTFSIGHKKYLLAFAVNKASFSSCIYKLDLATGKRVGGTLWHSGAINNAFIYDFNNDGNLEVVFSAINNAYDRVAMGVIKLENFYGQCPTKDAYRLTNIPTAKLLAYIIFPKTDLNSYMKYQNPICHIGSLIINPEEKYLYLKDWESENPPASISYKVHFNWHDINIIVSNSLKSQRDSLVAHHILKPPYTNSSEYMKQLSENFLFWNGSKLVNEIPINYEENNKR